MSFKSKLLASYGLIHIQSGGRPPSCFLQNPQGWRVAIIARNNQWPISNKNLPRKKLYQRKSTFSGWTLTSQGSKWAFPEK